LILIFVSDYPDTCRSPCSLRLPLRLTSLKRS